MWRISGRHASCILVGFYQDSRDSRFNIFIGPRLHGTKIWVDLQNINKKNYEKMGFAFFSRAIAKTSSSQCRCSTMIISI